MNVTFDHDANSFFKNNRDTAYSQCGYTKDTLSVIQDNCNVSDKYSLVFHLSPEAILLITPHGTIYDSNNRLCEWLGYSLTEIIGKNIRDLSFLTPQSKQIIQQMFTRRLSGENVPLYELEFITKNNQIKIGQVRGSLIKDSTGVVLMDIIMVTDVTEQKNAQKKIEESEGKLRAITSAAQDGIIMIDDDGCITFWNTSAQKIFGYSSDEIIGKNLHEILAPEQYHNEYRKGFEFFRQTGKGKAIGKTLELEAKRKDGVLFPVELSLSSVKLDNRWCAVGIVRDISIRKQIEKKLQESEQRCFKIFNSSRDALMLITPPLWNFASANPATLHLFKAKNEQEFLQYNLLDISPTMQPDGSFSADKAKVIIEKTMTEGHAFFEWKYQTLEGKEFPATVLFTRIELEKNTFCIHASVRDITDQKKAEAELKRQVQITNLLKSILQSGIETKDMETFIKDIFHRVMQSLDYDAGGIYLVDENKTTASIVCSQNIPEEFLKLVDNVTIDSNPAYIKLFRQNEMILLDRFAAKFPEYAAISGFNSIICLPLSVDGEVIGSLNLARKKQSIFTTDDIDVLYSVTCHIHTILKKIKSDEAFHKKLEELQRYKNVTVDRELIMIELKNKIKKLEQMAHGGIGH